MQKYINKPELLKYKEHHFGFLKGKSTHKAAELIIQKWIKEETAKHSNDR